MLPSDLILVRILLLSLFGLESSCCMSLTFASTSALFSGNISPALSFVVSSIFQGSSEVLLFALH
jgi:hypothetical protein